MNTNWNLLDTLNVKKLCDVKLIIDGGDDIYASKAVLSSIEYFRNQFMHWPRQTSDDSMLMTEIKINSNLSYGDGQIRKISKVIIYDFIKLIYCINQPEKFVPAVTNDIQHFLELIVLGSYFQVGNLVSNWVSNCIRTGNIQLGNYDSIAITFNEFILTLDQSLIELKSFGELCRTIVTHIVVQNIFGEKLYSIIDDPKWRNAMCWLADFIIINHFDLTNAYHINAILVLFVINLENQSNTIYKKQHKMLMRLVTI